MRWDDEIHFIVPQKGNLFWGISSRPYWTTIVFHSKTVAHKIKYSSILLWVSGLHSLVFDGIHSSHSWCVNSLLLLFVNEHSKKAQPREQQEGSRLHQSANKRLISAVHIRWVRPLTNCLTYYGGSHRQHIYAFLQIIKERKHQHMHT